MRLLVVSSHLEIVGGVETYLRAVLPHLAAQVDELAILTNATAHEVECGITTGLREVQIWHEGSLSNESLYREIKAWRPDVVYVNGTTTPATELMLLNCFPCILYAHNYYGTCISGTKCHAHNKWTSCERTLGPGCLAAYFPLGCGGNNPWTMWKLFQTQMQRRNRLARYHNILVGSRHMFDEYRRHEVPESRLVRVPLFPPDLKPLEALPVAAEWSNQLLFAGRLTAIKGVSHLPDAVQLASQELKRPLELVIAGEGPERVGLERLCQRRRIPVRFLGWTTKAATWREMAKSDLLLFPSLWPEPFGLVGVEAGCFGVPAAGYLQGGVTDWLIPGCSGEGSSVPEWRHLAAAIVRALQDRRHWSRLRVGAWERAQSFSLQKHLELLLALFKAAVR